MKPYRLSKEEYYKRFVHRVQLLGGDVNSTEWIDSRTKMEVCCGEGHTWKTLPNNIMISGNWCPYCAPNHATTIQDVIEYAKSRGGKCLSTECKNQQSVVKIECDKGHQWETSVRCLLNANSWCPYCKYKMEEFCRKTFETLFKNKFPKVRPEWLRNPATNNILELDGYNEKLAIAFEYNGEQHYKIGRFFGRTEEDLEKQQKNDALKAIKCMELNIKLIIIPYWLKTEQRVTRFIMEELNKHGFKFSVEDL